jgi:phosphohistidine swiveling domain-containing protein
MTDKIFEAPGPGTWTIDGVHFPKPASLYMQAIIPQPLKKGFKEGTERYGLLASHPEYAVVHGFYYSKVVLFGVPEEAPPGPPPDGFFEQPELVARIANGPKAIDSKLWREDLKRWDEEVKPDSIRRNQQIQAVNLEALSTGELGDHLIDCFENLKEMWYRHHVFTVSSVFPTGMYLDSVCAWTGISEGEALGLLKGSSPISLGVAYEELRELAKQLKQADISAEQFKGQPAEAILQSLQQMPGPIASAADKYLELISYQLISGYDITEQFALETPEVLVAGIFSVMKSLDQPKVDDATEQQRIAIRNKVPVEYQAGFDELLKEARYTNRLRDERGVYNEGKAFGLSRRAILEAGKRLHDDGRLHRANALVYASHDEMLSMLQGEAGPCESELKQREDWASSATCDDVPDFLGPPPQEPPPLEALPLAARPAQAAIMAAFGNVADIPPDGKDDEQILSGFPVSSGVYEGIARLIKSPSDFHRLQQGDVLISKSTSASFNVVMPLLGALVTDRGGQLSHAAIVAREYGIPGIVGSRTATSSIVDGARVRVDGDAGTVEMIS